MAVETSKLKARLSTLSSSLDDLETLLDPLFSQTLTETILNLEPLQQAKLQTVLPYVVYDLVFTLLKLKGVDPKTHAVVTELDRIRQYFEKIAHTENPPARKTEIDKEAAGRFIKHAITQAKWKKTAAEQVQEDASTSSTPRVPVKVTSKMLERAQYEKELKEREGESEDDDLEVFDDEAKEEDGMDIDDEVPATTQDASTDADPSQNTKKRQRPLMDPFAGYGDETPKSSTVVASEVSTSSNTPGPSITSPKKKKQKSDTTPQSSSPSADVSARGNNSGSKKKKKSKRKSTS